MVDEIRKVTITKIDSDSVETDDSFPLGLAFHVYLSEVPDSVWRELFFSEYEQTWYSLKREMTVSGDKIRVVTAPGEEQGHVDFVKRLVEQTNKQVDMYNAEVKRQRDLQRQNLGREGKLVEEARERLKRVRL